MPLPLSGSRTDVTFPCWLFSHSNFPIPTLLNNQIQKHDTMKLSALVSALIVASAAAFAPAAPEVCVSNSVSNGIVVFVVVPPRLI